MRHDEHRDVLRSVPVSIATSAVAAAASGATIPIPPSSFAVAASALASTTGGAECDGVSASSAAARESVAADNAFRLVLDASPDGLPVLVWQRVPRCEQQRVLPRGRMEPRLLW